MATTEIGIRLAEEHLGMLAHIERLREVADEIGDAPLDILRLDVRDVYAFLVDDLIPHAQFEDRVLYPAVGEAMGAPEATATMTRDHLEVVSMTRELEAARDALRQHPPTHDEIRALRRLLYGLYALVKVHFEKEEEIYVPILETGLTTDEAERLAEAMRQHG